ncbi:hypothetical protein GGR74_000928 [Xanthomonas arboricola]
MAWLATKTLRAQHSTLLPPAGEGGAQRRMRAAVSRAPWPDREEHPRTKTDRAAVNVQQSLA